MAGTPPIPPGLAAQMTPEVRAFLDTLEPRLVREGGDYTLVARYA